MSLISGKYKLENNENFIQFMTNLGVPEEHAVFADKLRPIVEINYSGDKIEIITNSGVKYTSQTYIVGQECDEKLPTENIAKSVATVDGNTINVRTICPEIRIDGIRFYEFTNDGFILTLYGEPDAKRIYKRI